MRSSTSLLTFILMFLTLSGVGTICHAQSYSIRGVLSGADGSAVRHGRVTATLVKETADANRNSESESASASSDDSGNFVIPVSSAGTWKLVATAPGFRSAAFEEHGTFFTGVVLTVAMPSVDIKFRITSNGSISGYILDEAGEAVRSGAQVMLLTAAETPSDQVSVSWQTRGTTRPDDLGHYEFTALAAGRYQVMVQAQPWYAESAVRTNDSQGGSSVDASLPSDSTLDVAYPLTWYPSVTDSAAAGTVTLIGGDTFQADLRLAPVPSVHLSGAASKADNNRRANVPQIRQLLPNGASLNQPIHPTVDTQGRIDVGGLAPGTYEVTGGAERQPSILHIGPGSPRTLDLNSAESTIVTAIHFDLTEGARPVRLRFTNVETGRSVVFPEGQARNLREGSVIAERTIEQGEGERPARGFRGFRDGGDGFVHLEPGRYEVSVLSAQGDYLLGLSGTHAEIRGHVISIHDGNPQLTFRVVSGHASVKGVATLQQKPLPGAMVLLVPAMLGSPDSFATILRAQTDTSGGFHLRDVARGRYILVAIKDGWNVRWKDPATLAHYLGQGIPIDLSTTPILHQNLEAQLP
ncbi:carboxypeptidase-like regulatory domain-containing protein [Granulicella arctica]|uniref:carboxypeptidase-like regulatory domain-containing protein n=1 Tax=Granulicella arctica TaxID=940613 RepID=UPI0021DFFE45|nr:carboxypeptidase-like regulatory domain-containing protein [Granulicella arctica]